MNETPRVLYDASLLGTIHATQGSRAGIFRVTDTLARRLVRRQDCEVSLCASHSVWALHHLLKELQDDPVLRSTRFGCRWPFSRSLPMRRLLAEWDADRGLPAGKKLLRSGLWRAMKSLEAGVVEAADYTDYDGYDIYHSPFFPLPERRGRARRFVTVYDLIPVLHPEFYRKLPDQIEMIPAVVRSVGPEDWILTISQATRDDLLAYRPDLAPERVVVTPLAAADCFYRNHDEAEAAEIRGRYGIPHAPYVLSLSTLEPRKNIAHVIRCFARFVQQEGVSDLNLVLIGERGWDMDGILEEISRLGDLRKRIIITGRVPDADLSALYSGALWFAYMSFYEGFGLPPLEAMQCGVPVVTSNTSSLPEVVGEAAITLDPRDEDGLCETFLRLYRDESLRADLSERGLRRAGEFSWERCAAETVAAYRKALA